VSTPAEPAPTANDVEQIKQLKARYFRCIDTHDWDGLESVFATDARIDMTGEGGGVTTTAREFRDRLARLLDGVTSVHHGHMPEIVVVSDTQAAGIWAMEDKLWWPEGAPIQHLHGYGHYHERYGKIDGRWVITEMTLTRLRRDVTMASTEAPASSASSTAARPSVSQRLRGRPAPSGRAGLRPPPRSQASES
jgi:hypothetical protein